MVIALEFFRCILNYAFISLVLSNDTLSFSGKHAVHEFEPFHNVILHIIYFSIYISPHQMGIYNPCDKESYDLDLLQG